MLSKLVSGLTHVRRASALLALTFFTAGAQSRSAPPDSSAETRQLCGPDAKAGDIALFGVVRDAASKSTIDSVDVLVQWMDLTLRRGAVKRTLESRSAYTDR